MIKTISVKVSSANPNLKLPPMYTYVGSPSQFRIIDVPKKIGKWNINTVSVSVYYPDSSIVNKQCVLVGGCYSCTISKCDTSGSSYYKILASGKDESGNSVSNYVLGTGDVFVLNTDGSISIGETVYYMHLVDEKSLSANKGDSYLSGNQLQIYNGQNWLSVGGDKQIWAIYDTGKIEPAVDYSFVSISALDIVNLSTDEITVNGGCIGDVCGVYELPHDSSGGKIALTKNIPTKVSELQNDSGYTTNIGTITGITMNGSSKGTSGVVNLGTVLSSIGISDLPSEVFVTKGSIATSTNLTNLDVGLWMINGISNPDFPIAEWLYGSLIQFPGTYKAQLICAGPACAGPAGEGGFYVRRYLTSSSSWTAWITIPTKTSQLTNDSNFLTAHQSLTAYATKTELTRYATKTELTGYATKEDLNYDYSSGCATDACILLTDGEVYDLNEFTLSEYNIYLPIPECAKTADTIMIADYTDVCTIPQFTWYGDGASISINWMNIEGDETEAGNKYMYMIQTMPNLYDSCTMNGIMNIRKLNEGLSSN